MHAGGRPLMYGSAEEMYKVDDGLISYTGKHLTNSDFKSEKILSDYIEDNIEIFCKNNLNDVYVSHSTDSPIVPMFRFGPRTRRIDLCVKCEKYTYIIELKNPSGLTENRQGIGQILDYGREFNKETSKLLLITTKFDINTARTIKHYNLPISYMYIRKNSILEYKGDH